MEEVQVSCCKTKLVPNKGLRRSSGVISFLSSLLIILLPKCPLCVTAYMGAILLFFDIDNAQLAPFLLHAKPVLGGIIILMILLNYKGRKTIIASAIAGTALLLLVLSTYFYFEILADWVLYIGLFFAIWYNGNFQYFYRFIKSRTVHA